MDAEEKWVEIRVLEIEQPIGRFYFGAMHHGDLARVCYSDIRRINEEKRDVEAYLGIERPLRNNRVKELREYVKTVDATFPSSIILAIAEDDAELNRASGTMRIRDRADAAKILDGQHRIAGLEGFEGDDFDVLVTIFVDMDIEFQAMVFATINLEQTKVNRSLAYDLYAYATSRSPHKTCHNIARLLNSRENSPFRNKIKILGITNEPTETISQALFVDSLLSLISTHPNRDRDALKRERTLQPAKGNERQTLIFRNLFVEEKDGLIARVLWDYFKAVERKWDKYWSNVEPGCVLNRTTGFRGLMQFLPFAFVDAGGLTVDPVELRFDEIFARVDIKGDDVTANNYPPGTTGSTRFRDELREKAKI